MTKEEPTTKVVSLRFQHPEIIQNFDKKIKEEFGSTKKHKIEVIEKLLEDYTNSDTTDNIIEEQHQQITSLQQHLSQQQDKNKQLLTELDKYKKMYNDIQQQLQKKEEKIETLHQQHQDQLQNQQQLYEEKIEKVEHEKTKYQNKYDKQVALKDKLQEEFNEAEKMNNKYAYFFGAVTHMSLLNRILGNYPEEIKELQEAQHQEDNMKE